LPAKAEQCRHKSYNQQCSRRPGTIAKAARTTGGRADAGGRSPEARIAARAATCAAPNCAAPKGTIRPAALCSSRATAASAPAGGHAACAGTSVSDGSALPVDRATCTNATAARLHATTTADRGSPASPRGTAGVVADRSIHTWPGTAEPPPVEAEERPRTTREDEK
jgi:hypothetical protein